jgi:hypothetical protein
MLLFFIKSNNMNLIVLELGRFVFWGGDVRGFEEEEG